jgi:hypothetical protein
VRTICERDGKACDGDQNQAEIEHVEGAHDTPLG